MFNAGTGTASAGVYANRYDVGFSASLEARVSKALSAYAQASAYYELETKSLEYNALAGLRWRF